MARTSKKETAADEPRGQMADSPAIAGQTETGGNEPGRTEAKIPADVERLMQLYPQYERIYVTNNGFVHPFGVPAYMVVGATLYKNKYYNNK